LQITSWWVIECAVQVFFIIIPPLPEGGGGILFYLYKFSPFRRDRSNKVGGGVIVYVKNTVNCIIRSDLHVGSLECIWLEIKLNKMNCELMLLLLYPRSPKVEGVYCFTSVRLSVLPSFRPSKIFLVAFFSVTVDGRNLIFGHKHHIGIPYCGKRFWTHQIPTSCLPTKCAYMFNVYQNQLSRQTGSRNLMGPKTLPTIWGTYMKLVTKYQISVRIMHS
jgi:hypothetical protein